MVKYILKSFDGVSPRISVLHLCLESYTVVDKPLVIAIINSQQNTQHTYQ